MLIVHMALLKVHPFAISIVPVAPRFNPFLNSSWEHSNLSPIVICTLSIWSTLLNFCFGFGSEGTVAIGGPGWASVGGLGQLVFLC